MAVIGNLAVKVTASTVGLQQGLGAAAGMVTGFGSKIAGLAGKFGPLAAAITGVAGVGGFGLMVSNSIETISSLVDVSNKLGITTEALGGLRHAAELSGVSSEALDKSLVKMANGISEVSKTGKGGAAAALKELGLNAKALQDLSPDQQFAAITAAMGTVNSQTDKIRLSMDLFGKTGSDVLNIMSGGVEGLNKDLAEAKRLGLAPSSEDAAQVEAMGDNIDRAKKAFSGMANTVAIAAVPAINFITEGVVNFAGFAQSALRDVGNWLLDMAFLAEFGFTNIEDVAAIAWENVKLGALGFWEDAKHLFGMQIPTLLGWFFDNWKDIFGTILDFTSTVFVNMAGNVIAAMTEIWDFISSGGTDSLEFAWTPLTDGFINSIEALPDIPDRALTELEKQIGQRADEMGTDFGQRLGEHMVKRRDQILGNPMSESTTPSFEAPDLDALSGDASAAGKGDKNKGPAAAARGSAEAFSSIFAAMRQGDKKSPEAQATEKQTTTLVAELGKLSKAIAAQIPVVVEGDI